MIGVGGDIDAEALPGRLRPRRKTVGQARRTGADRVDARDGTCAATRVADLPAAAAVGGIGGHVDAGPVAGHSASSTHARPADAERPVGADLPARAAVVPVDLGIHAATWARGAAARAATHAVAAARSLRASDPAIAAVGFVLANVDARAAADFVTLRAGAVAGDAGEPGGTDHAAAPAVVRIGGGVDAGAGAVALPHGAHAASTGALLVCAAGDTTRPAVRRVERGLHTSVGTQRLGRALARAARSHAHRAGPTRRATTHHALVGDTIAVAVHVRPAARAARRRHAATGPRRVSLGQDAAPVGGSRAVRVAAAHITAYGARAGVDAEAALTLRPVRAGRPEWQSVLGPIRELGRRAAAHPPRQPNQRQPDQRPQPRCPHISLRRLDGLKVRSPGQGPNVALVIRLVARTAGARSRSLLRSIPFGASPHP